VNHILGCSELLLEEASEQGIEDLVPHLKAIHADGRKILGLVDDLLQKSEDGIIASGQTADIRRAMADLLSDVAERARFLLSLSADRAEVTADLRPIEAAAEQLRKVVSTDFGDAAESEPIVLQPGAAENRAEVDPASLLVVDDNEVNRTMLARRLQRLGHRVSSAASGREALQVLQHEDVDLVLLDVLMPDLDGFQVLEQRRTDERLRDIPFIMISALDEVESVARCIEMGAEDYLSKPFDLVLLQARVGACLDKKRLRDEQKRHLATIVRLQVEELQRLSGLRRFLSPQVAELIGSQGGERALESHRREITVAFCDLRGFTAFAETAEPEELMRVLREYHTAMGETIFRYEGTLERFAGDGMMIFFNDPVLCPDPALRATQMALDMRQQAAILAEGWRKQGYSLGFGVGIAQGFATLGRIGFEGRFDYGAIGTVTNVAARLCAEAADGQILVSQRVFAAVEYAVELDLIGDLELKGLLRPISTYNVLRARETDAAP
jgi:adenylate cyclase